MALIEPTVLTLHKGSRDFLGCVRIQYQNVTAGDTCVPVKLARYADRSVQVTGVYSGVTVAIHGTCEDDTNYAILTDNSAVDLSFTSGDKTKFITEVTAYTKPVISSGDANTLVNISFICRGQVA